MATTLPLSYVCEHLNIENPRGRCCIRLTIGPGEVQPLILYILWFEGRVERQGAKRPVTTAGPLEINRYRSSTLAYFTKLGQFRLFLGLEHCSNSVSSVQRIFKSQYAIVYSYIALSPGKALGLSYVFL